MPPALKSPLPTSARSGRLAAFAGLWLSLEVVGGIMFAAGLATALSAIAENKPLIWGSILLFAGAIWRAGAGALAADAGAIAARSAKAAQRESAAFSVLWARPGAVGAKGERITAIVDDVEALDGWHACYLPASQAARAAPLVALTAVFVASPISALILIAAFAPFIALMALIGMTTSSAARAQFDALARLSGLFVDRVRALPLVLAYGATAQQTAFISTAAVEVRRRTLAVLRLAFMSSAALEFFAALSVALVAVYIGFNLLGLLPFHALEHLDLWRGVFVLALAPEVYAPLRRLASAYHDKQAGEAARERIAVTLQTPAIARPSPCVVSAAPTITAEAAIVRHAGGAEIGPISFTAPAGAITALLGPSGTGKTSLLQTLIGIAPLAAGEVRAGGVRLSDVGSFALIASYAAQRPTILPRSIGDNIRIGDQNAADADIKRIADAVGLNSLLARRGADAMLDERGSGLSGGERRRIGIARALLKRAPLILLDEPTADLDATAEDEMIALLHGLRGARTIIVATHSEKLATAADHMVRLT